MCQVGWVGMLFLPVRTHLPSIAALVVAEISVPIWAQSAGMMPWHPHRIAERYELFMLIVLGESVASAPRLQPQGVGGGERNQFVMPVR